VHHILIKTSTGRASISLLLNYSAELLQVCAKRQMFQMAIGTSQFAKSLSHCLYSSICYPLSKETHRIWAIPTIKWPWSGLGGPDPWTPPPLPPHPPPSPSAAPGWVYKRPIREIGSFSDWIHARGARTSTASYAWIPAVARRL